MIMACNTLEVLRLREELIRVVHEGDVLADVYRYQLRKAERQAEKLVQAQSTGFDTSSITKENANFVDFNDGSKLEIDLAFTEFDTTLKASLDFRSESCIKALMTNLGVEELRAVLRYQLTQKQLLAVAVMRNQALMDGPQQGLKELKLLQRRRPPITVPGAMVQVLSRPLDGPSSQQIARERQRMSANLAKEVGPHILSITALKSRHRQTAAKKWAQIYQRVAASERSVEVKLRILRASRMRLLHEFCQDVLEAAYMDSLAI